VYHESLLSLLAILHEAIKSLTNTRSNIEILCLNWRQEQERPFQAFIKCQFDFGRKIWFPPAENGNKQALRSSFSFLYAERTEERVLDMQISLEDGRRGRDEEARGICWNWEEWEEWLVGGEFHQVKAASRTNALDDIHWRNNSFLGNRFTSLWMIEESLNHILIDCSSGQKEIIISWRMACHLNV